MKIDLHSHTTSSDGALTPIELVQRAQQMQVDVLAITDHDTVAGIQVARDYAQSENIAIHIVAGVELSTSWHGFDIHIVGLGLDIQDTEFQQRLTQQLQERDSRAKRICEKLTKCGYPGIYDLALSYADGAQISRNHIAKALVERGAVDKAQQAFSKFLGKNKKAHAAPRWISIEEAIKWIHDAGGRAVLAHPSHYDMTTKWLRRLVAEFSNLGGDAMEITHPNMAADTKRLLQEMMTDNKLMASAGSDFHFPSRFTELGRRLELPETVVPVYHDWTIMNQAPLLNRG
ncbi:PHP domain-containing protein [Glaciecola sp. MH2013]|uniref:PHP domain-containing protein n=1 Tax=Glaciecola sp. MH2013 TaxID=2785524 RepID=UPI00189F205D|nr:PHP domain-containing protein [Glaciecola sp. MH2013]MBF7073129.1 PHP domain-containing protein [Glaciecola sp. MH2013]